MSKYSSMTTVLARECEVNNWNKSRPVTPEFLDSISRHNVLQPILVRPHPDPKSKFKWQIIAGERRHEAFMSAFPSPDSAIPAVVREMDDAAAKFATFVENFYREGLTPWQEAQVIRDLSVMDGYTDETAAAALGWEVTRVRRRKRFLDLTTSWQKVMDKRPKHFEGWSWAMFEVLAGFPVHVQEEILKFYQASTWEAVHCKTVRDLRQKLLNKTFELAAAPWPLKDEVLDPVAGSCEKCPKRSGTQEDLLGDVSGDAKKDRCLDHVCFEGKRKAWVARKTAEIAKASGGNVLKVTSKYGPDKPKGAIEKHNADIVKKGAKGAVPAIIVDGDEAGTAIYVIPERKVAAAEVGEKVEKTMAEKRAVYMKRRHVRICEYLQEALKKPERKEMNAKILALVSVFGTIGNASSVYNHTDPWSKLEKVSKGGTREEAAGLMESILVSVCEVISQRVKYASQGEKPEGEAKKVAALLGMDWNTLVIRATEEIPDPKSWAKEAAKPAAKAKTAKGVVKKSSKKLVKVKTKKAPKGTKAIEREEEE